MGNSSLIKVERCIDGTHGKPITFDITEPESNAVATIVFCHGFKGFKDWGHFNLVANEFASQGLTFVKLNFSHNGTTPDHLVDFEDLEAFGNNNFSKELDDLGMVMDWVEENLPQNKIFLMGHSRGGGIVILKAVEDDRVKKLVTWAAVSDFESRFPPDLERFKKEGVVYIPNARTHQNMPLYYQFVEDYQMNEERLNIPERVKDVSVPYLIIHGSEDESVSSDNATLLADNCDGAQLQFIDATGHTFDAKHPFEDDVLPNPAMEATTLSIDFFKRDH